MDINDTSIKPIFGRPLLEPNEERVLAMLRGEPDLAVDGLEPSLLSRLLNLFRRKDES